MTGDEDGDEFTIDCMPFEFEVLLLDKRVVGKLVFVNVTVVGPIELVFDIKRIGWIDWNNCEPKVGAELTDVIPVGIAVKFVWLFVWRMLLLLLVVLLLLLDVNADAFAVEYNWAIVWKDEFGIILELDRLTMLLMYCCCCCGGLFAERSFVSRLPRVVNITWGFKLGEEDLFAVVLLGVFTFRFDVDDKPLTEAKVKLFIFWDVTSEVVVALDDDDDDNNETVEGDVAETGSLVNDKGDFDFTKLIPDAAIFDVDAALLLVDTIVVVPVIVGFKLMGIVFFVGSLFNKGLPLLTIPLKI